ncbi:MAG: hypothetical protein ACXWQE_07250 [Bdellovibrionales bacterium]
MTKIVALVALLTTSILAFASPNYSTLTSLLYPASSEDQAFVLKFFEIVEAHRKNDPFLGGRGPSINGYSLDKIKFALMVNETAETIDLVFFHWTLPLFDGLELDKSLSALYGSNVYIMRGVNKKLIASQGQNRDELTNFSYILGAHFVEKHLTKDHPKLPVPQEILDWKPNPEYMEKSHPLRATLDTHTLVLLSPSREVFFKQSGITESTRSYFEEMLKSEGGYDNIVMGMMVHEMFHVKEGEDQTNDLANKREIDEDRTALIAQLQSDAYLKSLLAAYVKIVFSLGDSLKSKSPLAEEDMLLKDLKRVIVELKTKYENGWKFIWNYEYTEGFAEYVSAYSMIQVGITSLDKKIDLEKGNSGNNFTYRTGTFGGLYLANRLHEMPFKNEEDHFESVWEIILRLKQTPISDTSAVDVLAKYDHLPIDGENEVQRVIDYLVSTVGELNKE